MLLTPDQGLMTTTAVVPVNSAAPGRTASSIVLLILLLFAPGCMSAQAPGRDSVKASMDSLEKRLKRAEDALAVLAQQVADQASSGVTTRSRMQLELTGRVLVHAFRNSARVNNVDDPQFVRPDSGPASTPLGMTVRQTTLGAVLNARDVLGGRFVGDVDVDFFGGQQPSSGGRTFPLLRLRTARAAVKWEHGEILAGQETPLIAGLNPLSPSAIGTPEFAGAGNLWLWLPQVRGTVETGETVRIALQGAVLSNITGDPVGVFDTDVDAAERTGRPATEVRLRVRFGDGDRPSEVGCGGHLGWVDTGTPSETHAVACDARILVGPVDVRVEGYSGRGLRGLGGGGIGQNIGRSGSPLADHGGWAQLNAEVNPMVRVGGGCGVDQPNEDDVPLNGRLRNQSCSGYTMLRPSGPLFFGAEVRRLETKYALGSVSNVHISLAAGFEF